MNWRNAAYGTDYIQYLAPIVFLIAFSPLSSEAQTNITMCVDPVTGAKSFSDFGCPENADGTSLQIDRANGDSGYGRVMPKVRGNKTFSADDVTVAGDSQTTARSKRNRDCIARGDCDGFDDQFDAALNRKAETAEKTGVWPVSPQAPAPAPAPAPSTILVDGKSCVFVANQAHC